MNEAPVTFSLNQLWMLNGYIRHEFQQMEMWKFPPGGRDLNDQIAEAILVCSESGRNEEDSLTIQEYTLLLSKGDLYAIDFHIRDGMKDPNGVNVGREILLLTFKARRTLSEGVQNTAVEPPIDHDAVVSKMEEWKAKTARKKRAKPNSNPDDNSDH